MLNNELFAEIMKENYSEKEIEKLYLHSRPLMAILPKMENFVGKELLLPNIFSNPQGRSATFTTAQSGAAAGASKSSSFRLTTKNNYGIVQIDSKTIEQSKTDAGAFAEALTTEVDGIVNCLANDIAVDLYKDGWGARAVVSGVTATTFIPATAGDVRFLEVGMSIVFAATKDSGTLRAGGSRTISAINRNTGVVTVDSALDASVANGDTVFCAGDRQNTASPTQLKILGFAAWMPETVTATPFLGVVRTVDATRLAGRYYDERGAVLTETVNKVMNELAQDGSNPDRVVVSYKTFTDFENLLQGRVVYVDIKENQEAAFGFKGIRVNSPKAFAVLLPDTFCPDDEMYILQLNTWKMYSAGKLIHRDTTDGNQSLRLPTADGIEVRFRSWAELGCVAPGYNARVKIK